MGKFDRYAFSAQPSFDEAHTRKAFANAVPLKTLVIYCYDPRATEIPNAVSRLFGDERFPGDIILDGSGNSVASTTTIFPVIVAGGRAVDALRSITVAQHLFGIRKIVVVHHSHCGATSFTADGIIEAYQREHHVDISHLYEQDSICISDYEVSLKHDTALIRSHDGTPKHVDIFGYFYDIDTGALTEVVRDIHQGRSQSGQGGKCVLDDADRGRGWRAGRRAEAAEEIVHDYRARNSGKLCVPQGANGGACSDARLR